MEDPRIELLRKQIYAVAETIGNTAYEIMMERQNRAEYRDVLARINHHYREVTDESEVGAFQRVWALGLLEEVYDIPIRWTRKGKEKEARKLQFTARYKSAEHLTELWDVMPTDESGFKRHQARMMLGDPDALDIEDS